jgi:hypothetical protein
MPIKLPGLKGYTLIEAAVVFLLIAILAFGLGSFIVSSTRLWLFLDGRQSAVKIAQVSMNRLVTEIKKIKTKNDLLTMGTYEVQFNTFDLATSEDFKQVGSSLVRVSGGNTNTLAQVLTSPEGKGLVFTYLNSLDAVTAVANQVRTIRIWLNLTSNGQSYTLESSARIRANELH